ncbi:MAG: hypothetical protein ACJ8GJ_09630 [Vitreoscilla sp.]
MIEPDVLEPWIGQAAAMPLRDRVLIVQALAAMGLSRSGWRLAESLMRDLDALPPEMTSAQSAMKKAWFEAGHASPSPSMALSPARLSMPGARLLGLVTERLRLVLDESRGIDLRLAAAIAHEAVMVTLEEWNSRRGLALAALLNLAGALPASLPLDLRTLLAETALDNLQPRESVAWVLARAGGPRVAGQLGPALAAADAPGRERLLAWLRSIAAQVAQPGPPSDEEASLLAFHYRSARMNDVEPTNPTAARIDASPAPVSMQSRLHFVLQGPAVSGRTLLAGSRATLSFAHDIPPADALAVVDSDAVEAAREANIDVLLLMTATGRVRLAGSQFGTARFRQGRLAEPVHFELEALAVAGDGALHVDFLVKGESVHQLRLELQVTTTSTAVPAPPARVDGPLAVDLLDGSTRRALPPRQQIVMSLGLSGGRLRIALLDLRDGEIEYSKEYEAVDLDRAGLDAIVRNTTIALRDCYADERTWESFAGVLPRPPADSATAAALVAATELIAFAGARLAASLRADAGIAAALDYIETHAQDGARISVSTDNIFLPWELLYPHPWQAHPTEEQRRTEPLRPERFWGLRFAIETDKRGMGSLTQLARKHRSSSRKVSLNLNPDIRISRAASVDQPSVVNGAWAQALERERLLEGCQQDCKQMRRVLQDGRTDATILYLYCHGQPPNPALGRAERLELDANCALEPGDLSVGDPYGCAPIVFLNSCSGALSSPLASTNFLAQFRQRGALGMIGTTYDVPIAFGAHFGREVVNACLELQGSLAEAMLRLRRRHFRELGNPLPLFYTLQCYLERALGAAGTAP